MKRIILCLSTLLVIFSCARQSPESMNHDFLNHDFLHHMIDEMHDSPMQQKFRAIRPMPAGVVYLQRPGEGEEEIRQHFRLMRELGFNALKQLQAVPGYTNQQLEMIALEEGIIPWWYGEGGWEKLQMNCL
jgi:beta-galactosidase